MARGWGFHLRLWRRRQMLTAGLTFALALSVAATIFLRPRPLLLWNRSASSPVGLYRVLPANGLRRGDHVAAWAPSRAQRLAAERHYLPANVPLVKRVAAVPGDRLCLRGALVLLNGRPAGRRRLRDALGRAMPWPEGCVLLAPGRYLLFDGQQANAFDGRYFGLSSVDEMLGEAVLLWPR